MNEITEVPLDNKKKLAAYYTPGIVTDSLSNWAVRSKSDTILEPSFGGCNFLTSSLNRLERIGNKKPLKNIFGFDIDPSAFSILKEKGLHNKNFRLEDFLESRSFAKLSVHVILGNPPYLPIHKLNSDYRNKLYASFKTGDFIIPGRSSLWVYFIVNSLKYLKLGGRMAWVVPDSIAFTDYGKSLLKQVQELFKEVYLFRIEERFFSESGTAEKTAFLLCDGYKVGRTKIAMHYFKLLDNAIIAVQNLDGMKSNSMIVQRTKHVPLSNPNFRLVELGTICDIKIGIVTGASKLLLYNEMEAKKSKFYPAYMYPIVSKGEQLDGISVDLKKLKTKRETPIYLLDGLTMEQKDPALFSELLSSIPSTTLINKTFAKRTKLFGYDDFRYPDAFLTFYSQGLPKIVINSRRKLNCTNSIHRLYLKKEYKHQSVLKLFALQAFAGLMADHVKKLAREYGNGILKFEPSDAARMPFYLPISNNQSLIKCVDFVFRKVENLINARRLDEAKSFAHNFLKATIYQSP